MIGNKFWSPFPLGCLSYLLKMVNSMFIRLKGRAFRAGPGVSLASPWARATSHLTATNQKKNIYYTLKKKNQSLLIYIKNI